MTRTRTTSRLHFASTAAVVAAIAVRASGSFAQSIAPPDSAAPSPASPAPARSDAVGSEAPVATSSSAAPDTARATDDDPVALFNEAVAMLQDQRHREAARMLERVANVRETPAVLYNLAVAYRGAGQYVASVRSLERYLVITRDRIDEARRREVGQLIDQARGSIAHVPIRVDGVGVSVLIDGEPVSRDRLVVPVDLDPGRHVFRAEGDGLRPQEFARDVQAGVNQPVHLSPARLASMTALAVQPSVAGAEILVDQVLVGTSLYEGRTPPGQHAIRVRARGYLPYATALVLRPGEVVTLRPQLTRERPLSAQWWLWTGVSVLAAGITAGIIVAAASGPNAPTTGTLGAQCIPVSQCR